MAARSAPPGRNDQRTTAPMTPLSKANVINVVAAPSCAAIERLTGDAADSTVAQHKLQTYFLLEAGYRF